MEYLVTAQEMRRYDSYTSTQLLVPDIVLMERAAYGAYEVIMSLAGTAHPDSAKITVLCGTGNNGGDGIAIARLLYQKHMDVSIILVGDPDKASPLNRLEQDTAARYGMKIRYEDAASAAVDPELFPEDKPGKKENIIIDAVFGVGLNRPLEGGYAALTERINQSGAYVYAVDVPSGLSSDGGGYGYPCVCADTTLTFGFVKVGLVTYPGARCSGRVRLIDMGIDEFSINGAEPVFKRITGRKDIDWPKRTDDANKGTYGKLLMIAGGREVFGAAYMAAKAAFECGIGMVKLITHENNRCPLETALPEAMYSFYGDETTEDELAAILKKGYDWADAVLIGPGTGTDNTARRLTGSVLFDTDLPVIADADAIRIIAEEDEFRQYLKDNRGRTVIMTPHMGEYAYLTGVSVSEAKESVLYGAKKTADELNITLICKDARSVTASCAHSDIYVNTSGNEGMATAGSGDVLAGMCSVMLIQTHDTMTACAGAAYLHGLAGDDAKKRRGSVGMTATDIIDSIQSVIGTEDET